MVGVAHRVLTRVTVVSPAVLGVVSALVVLLLLAPRRPRRSAPVRSRSRRRHRPSPRVAVAAAALALGLGAALILGGLLGVVVGAGLGVGVWFGLPRLETARGRRERDLMQRQVPLVVDLVAACLASGSSLEPALEAAARAVGAPTSVVLLRATAALRLGADPAGVWREVALREELGGLARAVARSLETGAPLSDLLPRIAERARAEHRARVESRVRTAAVRLTAPLGVAFLPAFVLLGVVPVVASWIGALL